VGYSSLIPKQLSVRLRHGVNGLDMMT